MKNHFESSRFTVVMHVIYLTFAFLFATLAFKSEVLVTIGPWAFGLLVTAVGLYKVVKGIEHSKLSNTYVSRTDENN